MNKTIEEIAHKAAEEIVYRSKADPDRIEVIIRQAIRDGIDEFVAIKPTKKNPNRDYISE